LEPWRIPRPSRRDAPPTSSSFIQPEHSPDPLQQGRYFMASTLSHRPTILLAHTPPRPPRPRRWQPAAIVSPPARNPRRTPRSAPGFFPTASQPTAAPSPVIPCRRRLWLFASTRHVWTWMGASPHPSVFLLLHRPVGIKVVHKEEQPLLSFTRRLHSCSNAETREMGRVAKKFRSS